MRSGANNTLRPHQVFTVLRKASRVRVLLISEERVFLREGAMIENAHLLVSTSRYSLTNGTHNMPCWTELDSRNTQEKMISWVTSLKSRKAFKMTTSILNSLQKHTGSRCNSCSSDNTCVKYLLSNIYKCKQWHYVCHHLLPLHPHSAEASKRSLRAALCRSIAVIQSRGCDSMRHCEQSLILEQLFHNCFLL